jgi:hypothetical protein
VLFTPETFTFVGQNHVTLKEQQQFHLIITDDGMMNKVEVGRPVELKVSPTERNTAYHHTPVMFVVSSFRTLPPGILTNQ